MASLFMEDMSKAVAPGANNIKHYALEAAGTHDLRIKELELGKSNLGKLFFTARCTVESTDSDTLEEGSLLDVSFVTSDYCNVEQWNGRVQAFVADILDLDVEVLDQAFMDQCCSPEDGDLIGVGFRLESEVYTKKAGINKGKPGTRTRFVCTEAAD